MHPTQAADPTVVGIAVPPHGVRLAGDRVLVSLRFVNTPADPPVATASITVAVYGYNTENTTWYYLGTLNGAALTVDTATWSPAANEINFVQAFTVGAKYNRLATRVVAVAADTAAINTRLGFSYP